MDIFENIFGGSLKIRLFWDIKKIGSETDKLKIRIWLRQKVFPTCINCFEDFSIFWALEQKLGFRGISVPNNFKPLKWFQGITAALVNFIFCLLLLLVVVLLLVLLLLLVVVVVLMLLLLLLHNSVFSNCKSPRALITKPMGKLLRHFGSVYLNYLLRKYDYLLFMDS